MPLILTLFIAGMLTIALPCILPLIPIVLGVSIAGRSRLRPLFTVLGMVVSFVGFTFLLLVVLRQFVELADYLRIGTYYVLLLFGAGFLFHTSLPQYFIAALGGLFFLSKGIFSVFVASTFGIVAVYTGGKVASRLQQLGTDLQSKTRAEFGQDTPISAFIIGLTMGLVWVPCAGPALGFAFALVRDEPGLRALIAITTYALGTAVPLLLVGYGGQIAVHSVRNISKYSGSIKQVSGVILIATALAFQFQWFTTLQTWIVQNTMYGTLGTDLEELLFNDDALLEPSINLQQNSSPSAEATGDKSVSLAPRSSQSEEGSVSSMKYPTLPKLTRAPEFTDLGPWHNTTSSGLRVAGNSEPFTLESLKGKVVLVDFWTYSCINCIRTLPYIQGYWEKFENQPFVLIGVHTPEFVFEKNQENVADAIERHGLTYPVAQDNDFGTWRAFANRYWPAKYLIDADGYIRYTHFGEGAYEETDMAIQSLLAEIGAEMGGVEVGRLEGLEVDASGRPQERTGETYLSSRSWPALGNGNLVPTDEVVSYKAPSAMDLHSYYLVGEWQLMDDERQVLRDKEGQIRMRFLGSEINLVMGREDSSITPTVDVEVDGTSHPSFMIDRQDLFPLWKGTYGEHDIILTIHGTGAEGYAFTFGS